MGAGGAERVMAGMCNFWAARDNQITLVLLRDDVPDHYLIHEAVQRVTVDSFWSSVGYVSRLNHQFMRLRRLRETIVDTQPDVVISFIDKTNIRVLMSLYGVKIPVVVSERCDPGMNRLGFIWNLLRKLSYGRAAALVAQTGTAADWFIDALKTNPVDVIANAVSETTVLPFLDRKPHVVAMGRLAPQKGIDLLLHCWAGINTHSRWQLRILGDGKERQALETLAQALGISETVHFHGNVSNPDVILRQAAIFVLPSRYEGFPNALLEAMACGLAAVSFKCPSGPADIIRHGHDGILVPPEQTRQLTQAIQRLIDDQVLRETLSRHAITVSERYSPEQIMLQWDRLISRSIGC